jgi:hypothetical protein
MYKNSLILFISMFLCMTVYSQEVIENMQHKSTIIPAQPQVSPQFRDTIQYTGNKYTLNNENLTLDKMSVIMQNNTVATEYLKSAKGNSGFANILAYAGGFMIGYPLGTALGGGKPNWTLAAVGCGLIVIDIPIVSSANKKVRKAVNAYNQVGTVSRVEKYDVKLGMNQNGMGLAFRF